MILFKVKGRHVEGQKSRLLSSCILSLFVAIIGCSKQPASVETVSEPVYSKQYRQHSTTAIVMLSETNIPTSGSIQLIIDVHAPAGMEVLLPEPGNFIYPFSVADGYTEPIQTLSNGKRLHRRVWKLTPGLSGDHIFQPLEILAGPEILKTDPINIHVESLLPAGTDSLAIKDIAAPMALLPEEQQRVQLIRILSGTAGALVLLMLGILLSRRRPKPEIPLNPHEVAWQALEDLPADDLERIQALNTILLQFIEAYLNVPTVGKTRNEIISKLPRPILLGQRYPLEDYLTASEAARFSHKVPPDFSENLEYYIREFIQKNKEAACD